MKKRLFAIMLALAMLLAAVPALAEEGGEALETAAKKICKACKKEVESVDANGLCAKCALEQDNTQQKMVTKLKVSLKYYTCGMPTAE